MIRMLLEKNMSTLLCIVLLNETGRAVESPSIDMLPASCALLVWYRRSEVVTNILYHQLADGLVHFGGVGDACLVGGFMELS